jgi:carboxymethylenebutenolidase
MLWLATGAVYVSNTFGASLGPEIVHFRSGDKTLGGEIYKPEGPGPFPAVLYNHGSAPGMLNSQASRAIAPRFVQNGWVFFMPYRRGQGLSANAGTYIGEEIASARKRGGLKEAILHW